MHLVYHLSHLELQHLVQHQRINHLVQPLHNRLGLSLQLNHLVLQQTNLLVLQQTNLLVLQQTNLLVLQQTNLLVLQVFNHSVPLQHLVLLSLNHLIQ
jgi:hypothetical protein